MFPSFVVIPGRDEVANPESMSPESKLIDGFRACATQPRQPLGKAGRRLVPRPRGRHPPALPAGRSSGICPRRSLLEGAFRPSSCCRKLALCGTSGKCAGNAAEIGRFPVIKSKKTFPQPFPKAPRLDTYAQHPTGFARGCLPRKPLGRTKKATRTAPAATDRPRDPAEGKASV